MEVRPDMQLALAIAAGVIGLFVTGAAVFTAWLLYTKQKAAEQLDKKRIHIADVAGKHFLSWTVFDAALFMLLVVGLLFLFVDLMAVFREREQFPDFHFAYLVCGFAFISMSALFMTARFALMINSYSRLRDASSEHDHH